tara:strand:- start:1069 stop:1656 length:588 start_codon:yes stop_codon:yes gene_type:complete
MLAPRDIPFSCTCGMLKGTLRGASPRSGTHAECFCTDCRAAEIHLGQPDPAPNPVGIFQTTPDKIHIDAGNDQLAVFSFGDKNLLRWYASCCGAPLFNTMRSPKFAFVGVRTNRLDDTAPLGPIVGRGFVPVIGGKPKHEGLPHLIWGMVSRVTGARLSGRWKQTPFFDTQTLTPTRDVQVLPKGTRASLLPKNS